MSSKGAKIHWVDHYQNVFPLFLQLAVFSCNMVEQLNCHNNMELALNIIQANSIQVFSTFSKESNHHTSKGEQGLIFDALFTNWSIFVYCTNRVSGEQIQLSQETIWRTKLLPHVLWSHSLKNTHTTGRVTIQTPLIIIIVWPSCKTCHLQAIKCNIVSIAHSGHWRNYGIRSSFFLHWGWIRGREESAGWLLDLRQPFAVRSDTLLSAQ